MVCLQFEVAKPDGQRITGESNTLEVTVTGRGRDTPYTNTARVVVPDTGIVPVSLTMPSNDYWSVSITSTVSPSATTRSLRMSCKQ